MATLAERYAQQTKGAPRANSGMYGGVAAPAPKKVVKPTQYVRQGGLPGPIQKVADVTTQTFDIGQVIAKKTAGFVKNTGVDIYQDAFLTGKTVIDYRTQTIKNKLYEDQSRRIGDVQTRIISDYKSGKMSKDNYIKALDDINKALNAVSEETQKISNGPSPQQRAMAVVETAINVLAVGSVKLGQVGAKQAFQAGNKAALQDLITVASNPLEKASMKIPALRPLIERNLISGARREAQKLAGESTAQWIARDSKNIAVGLLIKRPIFYQSNIAEAKNLYTDIIKKDLGGATTSAAWLGIQMIEGGPLGAVFRGGSWLSRTFKKLSYGKGSFIDEVSKQIGDGNPNQIARFLTTLKNKAPNEFAEAEKTYRILAETNLQMTKDDVVQAAEGVLAHYDHNHIPRSSITPGQLYRDMMKWQQADELAQKTIRSGLIKGISPEDANQYVVVRWDKYAKIGAADTIIAAGDNSTAQRQAIQELANRPGVGWGNNEILMANIQVAIREGKNAEDVAKRILQISTASTHLSGVPKRISDKLAKLGFTIAAPHGGRKTPIVAADETRKLVSGAMDGNTDVFDPTIASEPLFESIAGALRSSGLSPEAASKVGSKKLAEEMVSTLDELGLSVKMGLKDSRGNPVVGGQAMLSRLQDYVESKRAALGLGQRAAITDIRQLTLGEIQEALKVSKMDARTISRSIMEGYTKVPLEYRGLGDKIVDTLYRVNPLHKYYSRIQSAFRYTYNPFFRTQERAETKILSQVKASNLIWQKGRKELDAAADILDRGGIFTSSLPGEAAQDQVLGRITANVTSGQKRDLAGLALDIAETRGITLQQMVNEHSEEVDDALRVIVQYPRQGILASPLARTMNLMFFPMRYNIKVTKLAAEALAAQPPTIQKAVLHSGFQLKNWLKSDEGIRWQNEHADAIAVLSWLTPINSIQYTMNLLNNGADNPSDLGQLGGLPLGFITQILDSEGIIHLNKPYVNPKSGEVMPDYIPDTTSAMASVALGDLIGSMFTYPGRILGLPGKQEQIRKAVDMFIDTNGKDFHKDLRTDDLTPLQQNWVRVLKGDTSDEAIDALYNSPAPGQFNWYTIPPIELPLVRPLVPKNERPAKRTGLSSSRSAGARRKKTALPIPQR